MTEVAGDELALAEKAAEAAALGISAGVAPLHGSIITLLEEHPAPWSYQEELEGRPVPKHYKEEPDAYTDDARRRHVVRDARGEVVIECVKFSKTEEEDLARRIATIPQKRADVERLRSTLIDTLEISRLKMLKQADRLRGYLVECESTITKLTRLAEALKTAGDESQRHPMPWDYKKESLEEGAS
jgi:hypothetical protein